MSSNWVKWQTYLKERSPLPAIAMIGFLQSISSNYLYPHQSVDWVGVVLSTICLTLLLILMRLMDEIKDHQKDLIAHPERPLPRGLITPNEMHAAVQNVTALLLVFSGLISALRSPVCGGIFAVLVLYLLLMYKEFFCSKFINKNAFFYAITHQVILIPMYIFSVTAVSPEQAFTERTLWFSLTGLGASFAFEVCRKLDPNSNPVLKTYLALYGKTPSMIAILLSLGLLCVSAVQVGVQQLILPVVVLLLLFLPLVYLKPGKFKMIEGVCTLVGLIQLLSVTIQHFRAGTP